MGSPLRLVLGQPAPSFLVIWVETEKKAKLAPQRFATETGYSTTLR